MGTPYPQTENCYFPLNQKQCLCSEKVRKSHNLPQSPSKSNLGREREAQAAFLQLAYGQEDQALTGPALVVGGGREAAGLYVPPRGCEKINKVKGEVRETNRQGEHK